MTRNDDILSGSRRPVPVRARPSQTNKKPPGDEHEEKLAKLNRRVTALERGRWEIIVTIDENGLVDWTVLRLGKVEQ